MLLQLMMLLMVVDNIVLDTRSIGVFVEGLPTTATAVYIRRNILTGEKALLLMLLQ